MEIQNILRENLFFNDFLIDKQILIKIYNYN